MMWHEARKQEKKIRCMIVDYKKRAERRRDYYERIKADPTQFLQLHGRPCKIHLDPAVALAADSPANMMPWQGCQDILIDRFDGRAHLDHIPDVKPSSDDEKEMDSDERAINYERYRILVQNDFLGVGEEKFLHQLMIEEQFGPVLPKNEASVEGKKQSKANAAIEYNYDEGPTPTTTASGSLETQDGGSAAGGTEDGDDEGDDDDDSDMDFDMCVDVGAVGTAQAHEMNAQAHAYGMQSNDFFSFLTRDVVEADNIKLVKEQEEEKAMFSGRKTRWKRRAYREKLLMGRKISPPSYASKATSPSYKDQTRLKSKSRSKSRTRSPSPVNAGQITYITSFGGDEQTGKQPKPSGSQAETRVVRYLSPPTKLQKRRSTSRSRHKAGGSSSRDKDHYRGRRLRSYSRSPPGRGGRGRSRRSRSRSHSPRRRRSDRRRSSSASSSGAYRRNHKKPSSNNTKCSHSNESKSRTPSPVRCVQQPAPPVITRYYGRHKNDSSSSELSISGSDDEPQQQVGSSSPLQASKQLPYKNSRSGFGNAGGGTHKPGTSSLTSNSSLKPQERLKKKMQVLLNRQYKADKRAERERIQKAVLDRLEREEEMREITIKIRRRERLKRYRYYQGDYSEGGDEEEEEERADEEQLSSISSGSLSNSPSPEPTSKRNERRNSRLRRTSRSPESSRRTKGNGRLVDY